MVDNAALLGCAVVLGVQVIDSRGLRSGFMFASGSCKYIELFVTFR
jgi:hypothetical protein